MKMLKISVCYYVLFKGVVWCDIMFPFVFGVFQAVCAYIRSVKLQRLKSQTEDIFFIKVLCHAFLKRLIQTRHVYVMVWEDLHNTAQKYAQWKKA